MNRTHCPSKRFGEREERETLRRNELFQSSRKQASKSAEEQVFGVVL